MDWLAACIAQRVVGAVFHFVVGVQFAMFSNQWEAYTVPKEMSQTLLTNKKKGNVD